MDSMAATGVILAQLLMGVHAFAADIAVPGDAPTIQQAITQASPGDRVLVGPGQWVGSIDFGGKPLTVESTHGPDRTVLDGDGGGSVVLMMSGEGPRSILRGFRITGGQGSPMVHDQHSTVGGGILVLGGAPTIDGCVIAGNGASYRGGGVFAARSALQLVNCTITGNEAEKGGGVYLYGGTPSITGGTVSFNEARYGGGGVFVDRSKLEVEGALFDENEARYGGGAMFVLDARPTIKGCRFLNNRVGQGGGAVHLGWGASMTSIDNEFVQQGDDVLGGHSGRLRAAKGACCFGDLCIEVLEQACLEAGGQWEGSETDCVGILASRCQALRPGDLDRNDTVDIRDLGRLMMIWGDLK
ncbi:MAG: hypothetical protein MK101_08775 [Phycisphaerales bacterium]|nr:hypothetical protein [Phycisphaerales bacterium]